MISFMEIISIIYKLSDYPASHVDDYQKVTPNFASVGDETFKQMDDGNQKVGTFLGAYRISFFQVGYQVRYVF